MPWLFFFYSHEESEDRYSPVLIPCSCASVDSCAGTGSKQARHWCHRHLGVPVTSGAVWGVTPVISEPPPRVLHHLMVPTAPLGPFPSPQGPFGVSPCHLREPLGCPLTTSGSPSPQSPHSPLITSGTLCGVPSSLQGPFGVSPHHLREPLGCPLITSGSLHHLRALIAPSLVPPSPQRSFGMFPPSPEDLHHLTAPSMVSPSPEGPFGVPPQGLHHLRASLAHPITSGAVWGTPHHLRVSHSSPLGPLITSWTL